MSVTRNEKLATIRKRGQIAVFEEMFKSPPPLPKNP